MSEAEVSSGETVDGRRPLGLDWDLAFLGRFAGPLRALARAMLAYIFIVEGYEKITNYGDVSAYMADNGVSPILLPLVILTELGGGLMVLVGLRTRWAAIALCGFCLLTAAFFHMGADQAIEFKKNIAIAGGFFALASIGPGPWSIDAWGGRR
jgi:putative oxidoreductase